jgi:hypothetical protein
VIDRRNSDHLRRVYWPIHQGTYSYDACTSHVARDTIAASASGGVLTDVDTVAISYTDTCVDDAADAVNDAFVVDENSKILDLDLFLDNGSGPDVDPATALLCIAAVNGNTASVGNLITISSGGTATMS